MAGWKALNDWRSGIKLNGYLVVTYFQVRVRETDTDDVY